LRDIRRSGTVSSIDGIVDERRREVVSSGIASKWACIVEERRRVEVRRRAGIEEVRRDGLMSDADDAIDSSEQRRIAQICAARQR